ncbi:hypothetical protein [Streptomyces rimosus]|uniref:hypothetical protein n=1 Tax=Streptomyces rimosus TaxID=1927 RepID=UPI0004C87C0B|nr:hypothetical protein [Streptomyces rimosus]
MLPNSTLLDSIAAKTRLGTDVLAPAADALADCERAVLVCATGMLASDDVDRMREAVRADLDCHDVAGAALRLLMREGGAEPRLLGAQLDACVIACERSNELCRTHAGRHEHCRLCTQATTRAIDACHTVRRALHP